MWGWFNICNLNVIHKLTKDSNHINISIYVEKASDKIHNPFIIRSLNKASIEAIYLHIIKIIHDKFIANITHSEKFFRYDLQQSRMPTLNTFFFNSILLEALARAIRKKEIKDIEIRKEKVKTVTICRWYDIVGKKS